MQRKMHLKNTPILQLKLARMILQIQLQESLEASNISLDG